MKCPNLSMLGGQIITTAAGDAMAKFSPSWHPELAT